MFIYTSALHYHVTLYYTYKTINGRDGGGGHNGETDQGCGVISLVTTLTGNPPQITHKENRTNIESVQLDSLFCNCMQHRAA
jgi:hypothetical protein